MAEAIDLAAANKRLLEKRERERIATPPLAPIKPDVLQRVREMQAALASEPRPALTCRTCGSVIETPRYGYSGPVPFCDPCLEQRERERQAWDKARAWWEHAANLAGYMERAGVLLEHADATPMDFSPVVREQLDACANGSASGLLVCGPVGTGKTRFAAAAVRLWLLRRRSVVCTLARQMFRRIRSTYQEGSEESEDYVIEEFCTTDLLVIDDLGREGRITAPVMADLHEVISRRLGNRLPTIVTTNLSLDEIATSYDAAIASRLGVFECVVLDGGDRRAP